MTNTATLTVAPIPQKVGLTLAAIQLFFTLTWTVYVIFLPQLAAQVGLAKESVLLILMMDQLIFLLADAGSLNVLMAAQFVTGGAWGVLMMSAFTAALLIGRTGREGLVTGSMFSLLALAAFVRMLRWVRRFIKMRGLL